MFKHATWHQIIINCSVKRKYWEKGVERQYECCIVKLSNLVVAHGDKKGEQSAFKSEIIALWCLFCFCCCFSSFYHPRRFNGYRLGKRNRIHPFKSLTLTFRKGCLCNLVSIHLPNFYSVAVFRSHLRAFLFIYFFDLYNLFSWPR